MQLGLAVCGWKLRPGCGKCWTTKTCTPSLRPFKHDVIFRPGRACPWIVCGLPTLAVDASALRLLKPRVESESFESGSSAGALAIRRSPLFLALGYSQHLRSWTHACCACISWQNSVRVRRRELPHLGQQIKLRGRAGVLPITLCRESGQSLSVSALGRTTNWPETRT